MRNGFVVWVLAAFVLVPAAADGQAAVGLRAGFRNAQLSTSQDAGSLNRLVVGSYFGFGISNRLALQFEAVYGARGADALKLGNGDLDPAGTPARLEMDYVEIPVLLRAGFPGERFLPSFFIGPYAGFLLGCELTPESGGTRECRDETAAERFSPRATDFGLVAGAGLDLALGQNTVFVDARYTVGLLSIEGGDTPLDARHNGLAVSAGFAVPLGR